MTDLNAGVAERLVEHLRADTTDTADADLHVPIAHFVDPGRAMAERALMQRLPIVVAHCSDLPHVGDFVTRDVLGLPLLIVRQRDGRVAAYANMCRHRGGQVEREPSGSARVFVCQYHGWAYNRDGGDLRNVPYEDYFSSLDKACSGLVAYPTEERFGFIWAVLTPDADVDVATFLGSEVEAQLEPFGLDGAVTFLDERFELDVNWKLVMDGAVDVLHPKFLHPNGVGKLVESNTSVWRDYGRHGQLFSARRRMGELARAGDAVPAAWRYLSSALVVFPNSIVIAAPDHVEFWTVWPSTEDAGRSITNIRFLVRPEILDDAMSERIRRSWEILEQAARDEDWPMERTIQRNAAARPAGTFTYGRSEQPCQHLHRELARDLG